METIDLTQIIDMVQNFGIWIIFAWLYIKEKEAHQHTREQYREDLREIANLRQNIGRVQGFVSDAKQVASTSEMKTFP